MNLFSRNTDDSEVILSRLDNYLARDILLKEADSPRYVRLTIRLAVIAFALFLLWAAIARVDIVAKAPGMIMPQSAVQVIQHLDGGRISRIAVQDGQAVRKGAVLIELDSGEAQADLQTARARYWALFARTERLNAFISGRAPNYASIPEAYRSFAQDEQMILTVDRTARADQARVLEAQLRQVSSEAAVLSELVSIRGDLAKDQLISRTSFLDTKRTLVQLRGQQASLRSQIAALTSERDRSAADQIGPAQSELAQVGEQVKKLEGRMARSRITSPMDGIVQGLSYRTVGGVIAPGAQVLNIVPAQDTVEAEVRVAASDVGHVRIGQSVRVKVSAFDFLRYGAIDGKVVMLSANSTVTDKGEVFYKTLISLDRAELAKANGAGKIQSGMTLEADIITDRQSVLSYLLRPIYAAFSGGFGER
ncbi:MAG: hypothetical protein RLZZ561_717 [Pseudomonadota bacterium]|jgi:HlyD family type I secretion membrane fusion protein